MTWVILPACISFLIKLGVLWVARESHPLRKPNAFIGLILVAMLHNVTEGIGYALLLKGINPDTLFNVYYVLTVFLFAFICIYAFDISKVKLRWVRESILIISCIVGVLILTTNLVVSGYESIGYSVTAMKGDFYSLFQLPALTFLISTIVFLIMGYNNATKPSTKVTCLYTLFALLPFVFGVVGVIVLMAFGYKINAMMVIPIASTLFILITLKTEFRHKITDIRRLLPFSNERRATAEMLQVMSKYAMQDISHKELMRDIEKICLKYKVVVNDGNVAKTAGSMDLPRSSVYGLMSKHGLSQNKDESD